MVARTLDTRRNTAYLVPSRRVDGRPLSALDNGHIEPEGLCDQHEEVVLDKRWILVQMMNGSFCTRRREHVRIGKGTYRPRPTWVATRPFHAWST